jgi:UDP-N-acetylmuramate-alanine ligase
MERCGTNSKDEPLNPIIMNEIEIFVNPYTNILTNIDESNSRKTAIEEKKVEKLKRKAYLDSKIKQVVNADEEVGKFMGNEPELQIVTQIETQPKKKFKAGKEFEGRLW